MVNINMDDIIPVLNNCYFGEHCDDRSVIACFVSYNILCRFVNNSKIECYFCEPYQHPGYLGLTWNTTSSVVIQLTTEISG